MKHYAKLTGFLLRYLLRITAAGMLVLAAAQLVWLFHTAPQADYAYLCYQEFVSSPSRSLDLNRLFFYGLLLLLCALDLWIFQAFKGKRKAFYTLCMLPGPRGALPLAGCSAVAICILIFFLWECAMLFAGYHLWAHFAPQAIDALLTSMQTADPEAYALALAASPSPFVNNDLYLSFIRSETGRLILPATAAGGCVTLARIGACAISCTLEFLTEDGPWFGLLLLSGFACRLLDRASLPFAVLLLIIEGGVLIWMTWHMQSNPPLASRTKRRNPQ